MSRTCRCSRNLEKIRKSLSVCRKRETCEVAVIKIATTEESVQLEEWDREGKKEDP